MCELLNDDKELVAIAPLILLAIPFLQFYVSRLCLQLWQVEGSGGTSEALLKHWPAAHDGAITVLHVFGSQFASGGEDAVVRVRASSLSSCSASSDGCDMGLKALAHVPSPLSLAVRWLDLGSGVLCPEV